MNKIRRAACIWLTGVMAATFIAGNVLAFAKTGDNELVSDALFDSVEFTDVTGKVDVTGLAMQNLSQSVIENAGYTLSNSGKRTVIVNLGTASVVDSVPDGESVTEYLSSYAGSKKVNSIKQSQTNFLNSLSSLGVKYKVLYQYTNVTNSVAIEVDTSYISTIKSIANVKAAYVSETYAVPKDITAEDVVSSAQSNYSNVYATGIYNSSDYVESGLDGSGITVAIIDSGFDYTHEAFTTYMPETISMDRAYVANKLATENFRAVERSAAKGKNLTVNDLYINDKVPFAYDYADKDPDVYPSYSLHGTHVAGIVAGHADSYKDKNGNVVNEEFLGVAPNAQLVICKTFTDDLESDDLGGATTEDLVAALDDCVALGVDIINMSLGTASGFSSGFMDADDEGQLLDAAYGAVKKAGINLICAASNEYSAGFGSIYGTNLATNPDSGTVGSPSTFWGSVSVASVNGQTSPFMVSNAGTNYASSVFYNNSSDVNAVSLDFIEMLYNKSAAYEQSKTPYSEVKSYSETFKYVVIPNIGQEADYTPSILAQLADKSQGRTIALVKRGSTTFEAKIRTAMRNGADAIIIYNNVAGSIGMSVGEIEDPIPSAAITLDEGTKLLYDDNGRSISTGFIEVNTAYNAGPFMNEYSSWGSTPDLKLKPDVTAHGGEITSTVPGGYDEMSGTSMASPNLAGFAALLRGYLKNRYPDADANELTRLSNQILMSTATTVYDRYGLPYSPRKQGSGLATLKNALTTNAYLWTDEENGGAEDNRPKIELGEDEAKSGNYTFSFYVSNFGENDLSFTAKSNFFTETLSSDGLAVAERAHYLTDVAPVWVINENGANSRSLENGEEFTVKSGEYAKITVTLQLSDAEKRYIDTSFPNGMFVEGFITLASSDAAQCDLNLPFMGFYGDWESAPMLDYSAYEIAAAQQDKTILEEHKPQATVWETQAFANYYNNKYSVPMGSFSYVQDPNAEQVYTNSEYAAISRYNWYYGEDDVSNYLTTYEIRALYAGLLRNAAIVTYDLYDVQTGELITRDNVYRVGKAYAAGGSSVPAQVLLELEPEALGLVNNGKYALDFYFYFNEEQYNEGIRNDGNTFSMTFYVDYEAPILAESRIRYFDYKDTSGKDRQRAYLDLDIYDNTYAQSVILCYSTAEDPNDATELRLVTQYITPVHNPVKNGTTTVSIEITDLLAEYSKYKDRLYVQIDDYALNHRVLKLNFTNSNASQLPSQFDILGSTDITIGVNETYKVALSYEGSANLSNFTWDTDNERFVKVFNGEIFGVAATRYPIGVTVTGANGATRTINVTVVDRGTKLTFPSSIAFGMITSSTENIVKATGTVNVNAGQTFTLDVVAEPWYYSLSDYELVWNSTETSIADVDEKGKVTVYSKKGLVTISADIYDGSIPKCTASVTLNVLDPFTISNYSLTKYSGTDEVVVIPNDKNITSIGEEAFKDNTTARVIIIPKTVTTINAKAFLNCTALEEVYFIQEEPLAIPDASLTTIMRFAFSGCTNLKKVDLSNCKTITVDRSAFEGCSSLEEIVKMDNIGTMYARAFYGCTSLESIDITGLHVAGTQVFANCTSLTDVKTGFYTAIGEYMFSGCTGLKTITLNAKTVEASAFVGCTNLTTVNFGVPSDNEPVSETYVIGARAFYGCSNLTTLNFNSKTVTDIGDMAFANCSSLTTFTLPEGLENLGDRVFYNTDVTFSSASGNYSVANGAVYSGTTLLIAPKQVPAGFSLKSGTTAIGSYAFSGCTFASGTISLTGITAIGEGAFANSNLSSVTIPSGVKEISDYAFTGTGITEIVIPASVEKIGLGAFYNCESLAKVTFAASSALASVGDAAFSGTAITSIVLPDGAKTMGNSVFEYCTYLTEAVMPSVTSLGAYTFFGCTNLEKVTFGSDAETLGEYTFGATLIIGGSLAILGCENLKTVVIGDATSAVGEGVFMGCIGLEEIDLKNVTSVGDGAFYTCSALSQINLAQLKFIGDYAFYACTSLEELDLENAEVIGEAAFYEGAYTKVLIPSAQSVGSMAFFGGAEATVELPASLSEIGYGAFANSQKLTAFTVDDQNKIFFTVDGVLYRVLNTVNSTDEATYELTAYPSAKVATADEDGTKTFSIYEGTATVKAYAVSHLAEGAVEKVILPYSVKTIGDAAFFESGITEYRFEAINAPVLLSEFYYLDGVLSDASGNNVYLEDWSHQTMFARNFNFEIAFYTSTILVSPLTSPLKIYYPSNGSGYDNYVYSCFFGTKITLGELMDDVTRELKKIIEEKFYSLDEINSWNTIEINKETTLMVSNFASLVVSAHELYNILASDYQLELLGEENVNTLFAVESALKPVKERFGIAALAQRLRVSDESAHRTDYVEGEKFDMTGLVLIVEYDDGTSDLADMNYIVLADRFNRELTDLDFYVDVQGTGEYAGLSVSIAINVTEAGASSQEGGGSGSNLLGLWIALGVVGGLAVLAAVALVVLKYALNIDVIGKIFKKKSVAASENEVVADEPSSDGNDGKNKEE